MKKILFIIFGVLLLAIPVMAQIGTQSKTLTWTAKGDDGNIGTASIYDIRYSLAADSITLVAWAAVPPVTVIKIANPPIPLIAGSTQTFVITGLVEGNTYLFAIKSADEVGNWSVISNILRVSILDITPPATITDLR